MENFLDYCKLKELDPYLVLHNIPYFQNLLERLDYTDFTSKTSYGGQYRIKLAPKAEPTFISLKDDLKEQFIAYLIFRNSKLDLLDKGDQISLPLFTQKN